MSKNIKRYKLADRHHARNFHGHHARYNISSHVTVSRKNFRNSVVNITYYTKTRKTSVGSFSEFIDIY